MQDQSGHDFSIKSDGETGFPLSVAKPSDRKAVSPVLFADAIAGIEALIILIAPVYVKFAYIDAHLGANKSTLPYLAIGLLTALVAQTAFRRVGLYQSSLFRPSIEVGRIFLALAFSYVVVLTLLYLLKVSEGYSRFWMVASFGTTFVILLAARFVTSLYARALAAEGRLTQRIAVYGSGPLAEQLIAHIRTNEPNWDIVGMFDDKPTDRAPVRFLMRGDLKDLIDWGQDGRIDRIIIAVPQDDPETIELTAAKVSVLPVDVQLCPQIVNLPLRNGRAAAWLGPFPIIKLQRRPLNERDLIIKSIFDYGITILLMVPFLVLLPFIALAIRLDSQGSIFFRQKRHGFNHQIIEVFKFRTMTVSEDGDRVVQAKKNDKRVTRVGNFLRRTSLDELPQLINVLRGEMSLVGPRPHALKHNEEYGRIVFKYGDRLRVKPGITGWAQVKGFRGETEDPELMKRRVEHDLQYIDRWTIWLDFRILFLTFFAIFENQRAY